MIIWINAHHSKGEQNLFLLIFPFSIKYKPYAETPSANLHCQKPYWKYSIGQPALLKGY